MVLIIPQAQSLTPGCTMTSVTRSLSTVPVPEGQISETQQIKNIEHTGYCERPVQQLSALLSSRRCTRIYLSTIGIVNANTRAQSETQCSVLSTQLLQLGIPF